MLTYVIQSRLRYRWHCYCFNARFTFRHCCSLMFPKGFQAYSYPRYRSEEYGSSCDSQIYQAMQKGIQLIRVSLLRTGRSTNRIPLHRPVVSALKCASSTWNFSRDWSRSMCLCYNYLITAARRPGHGFQNRHQQTYYSSRHLIPADLKTWNAWPSI